MVDQYSLAAIAINLDMTANVRPPTVAL
jgi:hypothetical protein